MDPVTYKVFTDNTHIVAVRHGTYANVFAWETVERMNIKAKLWQDLVDDAPFTRADIITLQDPQNAASRNLEQFKYLQDGLEAQHTKAQEEEAQAGNINAGSLGSMGDKLLKAKAAVDKARKARDAGGDINRSSGALQKSGAQSRVAHQPLIKDRKLASNAAAYTTGRAAASFTSTGLTPETSGERALLTEEEYMLKPKRVKSKGYARVETNMGDLTLELHPEFAPRAVWNFIKLAQKGYYRGVAFHRNIPKFMIQGGDPSGTGKGGSSIWGKNFNDELEGPLTHSARGTGTSCHFHMPRCLLFPWLFANRKSIVSMANKGKNTNSSQFFITYKATPHLDRKHTVFGLIVDGLHVLTKMEATPVDDNNRPTRDIIIDDIVVYVDPFEEFQKTWKESERSEKEKEEIMRQGGTEDDNTTWTGKRIRGDGTVDTSGSAESVGKYLTAATTSNSTSNDDGIADDADTWVEPARKKVKSGGFGNFDSW